MFSKLFFYHEELKNDNAEENMKKFLNNLFSSEDNELYQIAFTHGSNNTWPNNQRLAFLGDSVLRIIIREHFYHKYPNWDGGHLSNLCKGEKFVNSKTTGIESNENYSKIAKKLKLVNYMKNCPEGLQENDKLNSELLEALFGAIYLDKGLEKTKKLVKKFILSQDETKIIENEYIKVNEIDNLTLLEI
jgi:ribonuclease-3